MTNQAAQYGVRIESAPETAAAWRVDVIRHLTPTQNRGKHNLFVDVVDEQGRRIFDNRLRIAWLAYEGDPTADLTPLDKPDTPIEMGDGNVDLYTSQTLTAWIVGDGLLSDKVAGIHTRHPDEPPVNGELLNSYGHHSFHVRFVRRPGVVITPPVDPDPDKPTNPNDTVTKAEFMIVANALQKLTDEFKALMQRWDGD